MAKEIRKHDLEAYYKKENFYMGKYGLRGEEVELELTEEQIIEIAKCKKDIVYFLSNYVTIIHPDHGKINLRPREFQKELIDLIENNSNVMAMIGRQTGKSIIVCGYTLHYILFNPDKVVDIVSYYSGAAKKLLKKLKDMYKNLPMFLQHGVVEWNKTSIEIENGCKVMVEATTEDSGTGDTVNLFICDEFAKVQKSLAEDFMNSVLPTLSAGKSQKLVIITTPKGMNFFYRLWKKQEFDDNPEYVLYKKDWRANPERDAKWVEKEKKKLGPSGFAQEHECKFLGSAGTLVSSEALEELEYFDPISETDTTRVYEEPKENKKYLLLADTAYGGENDYSAFTILKMEGLKYEQVLTFSSNKIEPDIFANYIYQFAHLYNKAGVLCESNDVGLLTINTLLKELDYDNIIHVLNPKKKGLQLGLKMTQSVKSIGCSALKELIESGRLIIKDFLTIQQLSVFVSSGSSFAAQTGEHDDLVMILVLFGFFSKQPQFEEWSELDPSDEHKNKIIRNRDKLMNDMDKLFKTVPHFSNKFLDDIF